MVPLNKDDPDHVGIMFKVRTNPEVDQFLCAEPPLDFFEHVKYLNQVGNSKRFFILKKGDVLCGYCQLRIELDYVDLGWALDPKWWGQGIGNEAVKLLVEYVKKQPEFKSKKIVLFVKKENERAIHLYKKHGFRVIKDDSVCNIYRMELS